MLHNISITGAFICYKTVRARQKPVKNISVYSAHSEDKQIGMQAL